jgi:hypothetical protein
MSDVNGASLRVSQYVYSGITSDEDLKLALKTCIQKIIDDE